MLISHLIEVQDTAAEIRVALGPEKEMLPSLQWFGNFGAIFTHGMSYSSL